MSQILSRHRIPRRHVLLHAGSVARLFGGGEGGARFRHAALEAVFVEFLHRRLFQRAGMRTSDLCLCLMSCRLTSTNCRALARAACSRTWSMICCFASAMLGEDRALRRAMLRKGRWRCHRLSFEGLAEWVCGANSDFEMNRLVHFITCRRECQALLRKINLTSPYIRRAPLSVETQYSLLRH